MYWCDLVQPAELSVAPLVEHLSCKHYVVGLNSTKTIPFSLKRELFKSVVISYLVMSTLHGTSTITGQNRLSPAESHLQDALLLLATIQHPSLDSLPKYQEAISLLSQIEHIQAAGFSLRMKLKQGLELMAMEEKMEGGRGREGELEASVEVLLQEPELVLQDPTSSLTGLALQGLLTAQVASRVSVCVCVCVCLGGEGSERIWIKCEKGKGKEDERCLSASVMNSPISFVHG